jgi:beta-xylosidase
MVIEGKTKAHVNPVYGSYFADPFVWKHGGTWYAIGTGEMEAAGRTLGKVFPVLQSADFYTWQFASNALTRPDAELGDNFWAPGVAFNDGVFYLYYSVGHGDKNHQLRVATSDSPQGPYIDAGKTLVDPRKCPFAIDPHPFQDEDGQWYMYYCRDFLDTAGGKRPGTALVAARMRSMTELEDEITVLRGSADWQRFEADRLMYGKRWDWHTLEGPCVVKRQGRYFCFYSGGRWENDTYGVDYCTAQNPLGPFSECGDSSGPRVLRTVSGHVIGPGHNTIAKGHDDQDYIVYHAWDKQMRARRMFIDRIEWTNDGPRCAGPTWGPEV